MNLRSGFPFLFVVVFLVAGGCIKMGPDFKKPAVSVKEPKSFQYAPEKTVSAEPEDHWWEVFGDPVLDRLVEGVLNHNLDIQQASARILELKYQVIQTRADQLPTVGFQGQANLPLLRQELGATQQALAVLLGQYPETQPPRKQPEDYYRQLEPVPPGLPSELLMRRPDIRAAEARLKALNAQVGIRKASRFPSITLTGSYGYSSSALGSLFQPDTVWSMAAGILQPLFDAGKLKAGQRAAEARYSQGMAEYTKTVLRAFSEVEKALLTRKEQVERREEVMNFLVEARYVRGLVDYLTVLNAQQTRFRAEDDLVLVDFAILSNRVTLHRALGGGWAKLPPVKGKETEGPASYTIW